MSTDNETRSCDTEELRCRIAALEERERRLRTTLYGIGDGLIATDCSGAVQEMNPVAESLTGWVETEARGRLVTDLFLLNEMESQLIVENPAIRSLRQGRQVGLEDHTVLISRGGHEIPITGCGSPIYDDFGEIMGAVLIFRDQTEKCEAERRESYLNNVLAAIRNVNKLIIHEKNPERLLSESCRLLAATRGYHGAWIFHKKRDGSVTVYSDDSVMPITRDSMQSALDKEIYPFCGHITAGGEGLQVVHRPEQQCQRCPAIHSYVGKVAYAMRLEHQGRDFGWISVAVPMDLVGDNEDQSLFTEIAEDISYALWSLETVELKRAAEIAAVESEDRFRLLFESSHVVMLVIDPDSGDIVDANSAAASFYGWPADVLRHKNIKNINTLSDREIEREMQRAKARNRNFFLFPHRLANGEVRNVEVYSGPIDVDGRKLLLSIIHDVTQRKEAEVALQKNENHLRSIFLAAPVGIGVVSQRVLIDLNERFCEITGYSKPELIGRDSRILYPSDEEYEYVGCEKYRRIQEHGRGTVETSFRRKDGKIIDVLMSSTLLNPDDLVEGVTFTILDITERKQAERALRDSEQRLNAAGKAAYDLIFEWNVCTDKVEWFGNLVSLLGSASSSNAKSLNGWLGLMHPDDKASIQQNVERLRVSGEPVEFEYRIRHSNGSYRYWSHHGLPLLDELGRLYKWIGVCTDITDRKQAEEELQKNQIEIDAIYRNAPLFMMLVDKDRRIRKMNNPAMTMAQRAQEEILGLVGGEALNCFLANEDPRGCGYGEGCRDCIIRKSVLHTFKTGEHIEGVEVPFPYAKDDGVCKMMVLLSTVYLKMPKEDLVLVCMQDITALKQSENERIRLEKQVQQTLKLDSIGRLAGGVAHDLNNLLTPILGYSELLVLDLSMDDPRKRHAEQVVNASLRAKDLVHQLLAFSRKQALDFAPVDVNRLLQNFCNLLRRTVREDILIRLKAFSHLPLIHGDAGQLEQVVMNLVVNAQDAMPRGGKLTIETGRVEISGNDTFGQELAEGPYVVLVVSDTGCGMDESTIKNLFEPFFSTKRRNQGTGLGLSTVYGIVKQHGGGIYVESEPGLGSTFKVLLPVQRAKPETKQPRGVTESSAFGIETILLVEDDPLVRDLAGTVLRRKGYTLLTAASGKEALALLDLHEGSLDLLLTDVVMPEMNGKELSEKVQRIFPNVRVLFMSGYSDDVISHRGVIDADVTLIQKPFSTSLLAARVRETLDQPIAD